MIEKKLRKYIRENCDTDDAWTPDGSDSIEIDSFDLIKFIVFLEEEFSIKIEMADVDSGDLTSFKRLEKFIEKRMRP